MDGSRQRRLRSSNILFSAIMAAFTLATALGGGALAFAQSSTCLTQKSRHVRAAASRACRAYVTAARHGTAPDLSRMDRVRVDTACRVDVVAVCAELAGLCYGAAFDSATATFLNPVGDRCARIIGTSCKSALKAEMKSPGHATARLARIARRCSGPIDGDLGGACATQTAVEGAIQCLAPEVASLSRRIVTPPPMSSNGETWVRHRGGTVCKGALAQPLPGTDVWVSPSGDDTNPGTSDAPLRTLARALCNAIPGQTIHVGLGTYGESVLLSEFGDPMTPIRIIGEVGPQGELPVLDGGGTLTMGIAIIGEDITLKSAGFVIEDIETKNYTDEGILAVIAENVTVRGCRVHDNGFHSIDPDADGEGFGVSLVDVTGALIESVEAYANGPDMARQGRGILGTGIDVFGSDDVTVRGCDLHDNIGGGLLIEDCANALVENNTIRANHLDAAGDYWDGGIWVDGGHDVTVRSNTLSGNLGPAIVLSDEGVQNPTGYAIIDNTLDGNFWAIYLWNFGVCPWPAPTVVAHSGNVFTNSTRSDILCNPWECGVGKPCG